jgi:radical SAM protein with 4Fe4S-binding SPASM domain
MRKEVAEWFSSLDWKYTYHEFGKYYAGEPWQYPRCHVLTFGSVELRSNGDLVLCMQKPITYGNIRDAPFSEIWNSPKVNAMRKWVKKCRGCYSPNMCDALNNSHFQGLDYKYVLEKINSPVAHLLAKTI